MGTGRTMQGWWRESREERGERRGERGTIEAQEEVKDEEKAMEDEKVAAGGGEGRRRREEEGRSANESRLTSNVPSLLALFFAGKSRAHSTTETAECVLRAIYDRIYLRRTIVIEVSSRFIMRTSSNTLSTIAKSRSPFRSRRTKR